MRKPSQRLREAEAEQKARDEDEAIRQYLLHPRQPPIRQPRRGIVERQVQVWERRVIANSATAPDTIR
jgi:hypothetical protein